MKLPVVIVFLLFILFSNAQTRTTAPNKPVVMSRTVVKKAPIKAPVDSSLFYKDTVIKWMSIEQAEAAQKTNPRKILVDVYTSWCKWCKVADSLCYKNRELAHYINQHFYAVKFDAESRSQVVFHGVRYNFLKDENKWVHEFAQFILNGKLSYPGTAFIDENGHLIDAKNGYMEAPYMETVLNFYGNNAYKKMKYTTFEDEFEGKIGDVQ